MKIIKLTTMIKRFERLVVVFSMTQKKERKKEKKKKKNASSGGKDKFVPAGWNVLIKKLETPFDPPFTTPILPIRDTRRSNVLRASPTLPLLTPRSLLSTLIISLENRIESRGDTQTRSKPCLLAIFQRAIQSDCISTA